MTDEPPRPDSENGHHKEYLPPLEFSSLVFPFYTQALIKLGLIMDPVTNQPSENMELAKRLIDILDLLRDRTKDNLEAEEDKFLEACLSQLKMAYLKKNDMVKA
jgi:ABC-type hemin transport system ATPase subunit